MIFLYTIGKNRRSIKTLTSSKTTRESNGKIIRLCFDKQTRGADGSDAETISIGPSSIGTRGIGDRRGGDGARDSDDTADLGVEIGEVAVVDGIARFPRIKRQP